MAIIRLDCNLNGGDTVTPNNELFYRIYGNDDNYATPIHTTGTALSDANVTVDNDNVIITGVDGTINTSFKIAAVDGAGNEGILSDAASSSGTGLEGQEIPSQRAWGVLQESASISDGGNVELEVRMKLSGNTRINVALAVSNSTPTNFNTAVAIGTQADGINMAFYIGDGSAYATDAVPIPDADFHIYKLVALTDGSFETFLDEVSQGTGTTGGGDLAPNLTKVYILSSGYVGSSVGSINGTIDWCKVNGELFDLNEGTGITTTSDLGTVVDLLGDPTLPTWVSI